MSVLGMIAGKFDPYPHEGHVDHIRKAAALCDRLIVVTHRDEVIAKVCPEGCISPLWLRRVLLTGVLRVYGINGYVMESVDEDGTVARTLELVRPDIFAKGGDRTGDGAMPQSELEVCARIGCRIEYGVGGLLNSSSRIKKLMQERAEREASE